MQMQSISRFHFIKDLYKEIYKRQVLSIYEYIYIYTPNQLTVKVYNKLENL